MPKVLVLLPGAPLAPTVFAFLLAVPAYLDAALPGPASMKAMELGFSWGG